MKRFTWCGPHSWLSVSENGKSKWSRSINSFWLWLKPGSACISVIFWLNFSIAEKRSFDPGFRFLGEPGVWKVLKFPDIRKWRLGSRGQIPARRNPALMFSFESASASGVAMCSGNSSRVRNFPGWMWSFSATFLRLYAFSGPKLATSRGWKAADVCAGSAITKTWLSNNICRECSSLA